jgi:ABC-2 type transport system permease protein
VAALVVKEALQIRRDPRLWRVILVAPLIQLIIFGYAVSTDVRHTRTFLVDLDGGPAARELADALTAGGTFRIVGRSADPRDVVGALDHGTAVLGVVIPPDFGAALAERRPTAVQLLVDGTNSNTATVALGYAESIVTRFGAAVAAPGRIPAVELVDRAWYNPDLASRAYNVPAVVGTLIMLVCLMLTSLAIVRERELGTLEQLLVSPLRPVELIAGKTLPFAAIGLVDLVLVTTLAVGWFGVTFAGSPAVLLVASLLFLACALGLGLFISTISNSQQEALMATFLFFMPAILLSGFMFPVASMPAAFRWVTLANPLRHYLEIVRGVFLKGTGLAVLWPQHLALALLAALILTVAVRRFARRTTG